MGDGGGAAGEVGAALIPRAEVGGGGRGSGGDNREMRSDAAGEKRGNSRGMPPFVPWRMREPLGEGMKDTAGGVPVCIHQDAGDPRGVTPLAPGEAGDNHCRAARRPTSQREPRGVCPTLQGLVDGKGGAQSIGRSPQYWGIPMG